MRVVKYWNKLSWEQAQLTNLTSEHLALRGRLHLEELKTPPVLTFSVFFASKFESSCAFWRSSVKAQLPKPHICNEAFWAILREQRVRRVRPAAECGVSRLQPVYPVSISVILQIRLIQIKTLLETQQITNPTIFIARKRQPPWLNTSLRQLPQN